MILSSKSIKKLKRKNANLNSVLHPELKLRKKQVTSGASRNVTTFKNKIPLQILIKKLTYSKSEMRVVTHPVESLFVQKDLALKGNVLLL